MRHPAVALVSTSTLRLDAVYSTRCRLFQTSEQESCCLATATPCITYASSRETRNFSDVASVVVHREGTSCVAPERAADSRDVVKVCTRHSGNVELHLELTPNNYLSVP